MNGFQNPQGTISEIFGDVLAEIIKNGSKTRNTMKEKCVIIFHHSDFEILHTERKYFTISQNIEKIPISASDDDMFTGGII